MDHGHGTVLELTLVLLIAALAIVPLAQKLRLSPVVGYLAAGIAIGPHGLGFVPDDSFVEVLAEFGIAFLLFTLGLELSIERLRTMRKQIFGLGSAQVIVTAILFALFNVALGVDLEAAIIIGTALALSSTAVVLQVLAERGELVGRSGRAAFAVLLFQDLAVAPMLVLIPILARGGDTLGMALGLALAKAIAAVTVITLIGRVLLRPFLRLIANSTNRDLSVALAIVLALGTGWATEQAGLSLVLGAFLAGLLLSETEYRHQIEADIDPFRGLLLGLFFMSVGMLVDLGAVVDQLPLVLAGVVLIFVAKAAVLIPLGKLFGLPLPTAIRVGFSLAQAGEFAFVIFGLALTQGVLEPALGQLLILVTAVSMAITPAVILAGDKLARRLEGRRAAGGEAMANEAAALNNHVILAGFGRNGETVAGMLRHRDIPFIGVEIRPDRVAEARRAGWPVFYGDSGAPQVVRKANLAEARAVVITINQMHVASRLVGVLRAEHPDLFIIVRARDIAHAEELERAGADQVILETLEASLQTGRVLLEGLGAAPVDVLASLEDARRRYGRPPQRLPRAAE